MNRPAGIYIHIPFCIRKCPYCDFYSVTDLSLKREFIKALLLEMQAARPDFSKNSFDTLYIGGGTPSLLDAKDIEQIIETAFGLFKFLADTEITLEANPGTLSPQRLRDFRSTGANRINIGVQSFQDEILKFLGRIHSAQDARLALQWCRKAGFNHIGLDLIYSIPGQSLQLWRSDLKKAVESEPEHLSCYMLTFESGTRLDRARLAGKIHPLPEMRAAELFEMTIEYLEAHGYAQYEISNFATSERMRSRHNCKYWADVPYRGFGPSAHSYQAPVRYWNCRSVEKYIAAVGEGRLPTEEREELSREQQIIEAVYLGLRTADGIEIQGFEQKFGVTFYDLFGEKITPLKEKGLIQTDPKRCRLTRQGLLFLDSAVSALI